MNARSMHANEMTIERACALADEVTPAPAAAHAALVLLRDRAQTYCGRWSTLGYTVSLYVENAQQAVDEAARSRIFDRFVEDVSALLLGAVREDSAHEKMGKTDGA